MEQALLSVRENRLCRIEVTPELLLELLKIKDTGEFINGAKISFAQDGIPSEAKALRVGITDSGNINLLIEHSSFQPTSEGQPIRQLVPQYKMET